ncbi:MAG TPA: helix-turn-helix transcriptional regulator [Sphingobacteriaceae bacterium]
MEQHTGAIVERVVRRSGLSITELARRIHVNRRSVYNWFEQKTLKLDIIQKIGCVLGHDFSVEFPEYFDKGELTQMKRLIDSPMEESAPGQGESVYFWMNKYIALLEKYNELLRKQAVAEEAGVTPSAPEPYYFKSQSQGVY